MSWYLIDNGSDRNIVEMLIIIARERGWSIWRLDERSEEYNRDIPKWSNFHRGESQSSVQLLLLPKNYGYAIGNNWGLEFINNRHIPDFVLIANTDITWKKGLINSLVEGFTKNSALAVVAPRVVGPAGEEQNPQFLPENIKIMQSWYRWFFPFSIPVFRLLSKKYDYKRSLEGVRDSGLLYLDPKKYCFIGACFMIDFSIFKRIGFFDPRTFLGTEEPRIVHRLKDKGYFMAINLDVSIVHDQGSTLRSSFSSRKVMEYFEESDYSYLRDYCGYSAFKILFIKGAAWYYRVLWMRIIR